MSIHRYPRNATMLDADRATHLKIVIVSLTWATMVAGIGSAARVSPANDRVETIRDYGRHMSRPQKINADTATGRSMTSIAMARDSARTGTAEI